MSKYYDPKKDSLLVIEEKASAQFWDKLWSSDKHFCERVKMGDKNLFIKSKTKKYLAPGSKILEGGCGIGQVVYGLQKWGYESHGVDYAEKTVNRLNKLFPELEISKQNVKSLDFPDNFFDGYWSLGVIEHFYDGYDDILKEMNRVIKPGGYAFITFPYISPLRRLKIKLNKYKPFKNESLLDNFYQFMLNHKKVVEDLQKNGFELVQETPFDALKGLKEESIFLKKIISKVYGKKNIFCRGTSFLMSLFLSRFAGHIILLIVKKNENQAV